MEQNMKEMESVRVTKWDTAASDIALMLDHIKKDEQIKKKHVLAEFHRNKYSRTVSTRS